METKDKIEHIRAKCIEANPSIKDLVFGCEVKHFFRGTGRIIGVHKYEGESDCYDVYYYKLPEPLLDRSPLNHEIIGRDIRLADVILATGLPSACANNWDLRKNNLLDQSEETIDFIYELLVGNE